jgi:hypothetical protein
MKSERNIYSIIGMFLMRKICSNSSEKIVLVV